VTITSTKRGKVNRAAVKDAMRIHGILPPYAPKRPTAAHQFDKATLRSLQRAALRRWQGRWDGRAK
jgi:hypothetical protein